MKITAHLLPETAIVVVAGQEHKLSDIVDEWYETKFGPFPVEEDTKTPPVEGLTWNQSVGITPNAHYTLYSAIDHDGYEITIRAVFAENDDELLGWRVFGHPNRQMVPSTNLSPEPGAAMMLADLAYNMLRAKRTAAQPEIKTVEKTDVPAGEFSAGFRCTPEMIEAGRAELNTWTTNGLIYNDIEAIQRVYFVMREIEHKAEQPEEDAAPPLGPAECVASKCLKLPWAHDASTAEWPEHVKAKTPMGMIVISAYDDTTWYITSHPDSTTKSLRSSNLMELMLYCESEYRLKLLQQLDAMT